MYRALCTIGVTSGLEGRGGSYGYGKAGLIRGSAIRTVIAYTCFRERAEDPGVTRRLLGMTYWGRHEFRNEGFTGFARFGKENERGEVAPFKDEEADEQAARLGLTVRNPEVTADLGTTFMLIDPTVTAEDMVAAIERSWWPALEDRNLQFNASVHTATGDVLHPRPRRDPILHTFIDAYEIATHPAPGGDGIRSDLAGLGVVGLVSDIEGWSYAEQTGGPEEQGVDHCSLVATMRKPRMVVEYRVVGRATPPYVRGVFVAGLRINDALRDTEPKGHDTWDQTGDADEESKRTAKRVYDRITERVRLYKKQLKPPARPAEEIELPLFDRLMRKLLSGPGKPINPDPTPRPFSIKPSFRLEATGSDEIRVVGKAEFAFSEHFDESEALIKVSVRYMFVEDDRAGEMAEIKIVPHPGFEEVDGKFQGTLRHHERAVFKFKTVSYRSDWSGRLFAEAEIVMDAEA